MKAEIKYIHFSFCTVVDSVIISVVVSVWVVDVSIGGTFVISVALVSFVVIPVSCELRVVSVLVVISLVAYSLE